ncbi:DUF4386 domain-containing protein [Pedococcus sp. KACC 23699]|uniref:DUF4386 domain-containing protein n=1 Tax=Pedococcus sp. KACC 23699 TaxID=3149228 RepID=A0AAU7JPP6_9MICO
MATVIRSNPDAALGPDRAGNPRTNAVVAGVLLVVATTASLLSGPFLAPVTGSAYLTDAAAHQAQVATGVLLGLIAALAAPGIAIALYPVLRGFGPGLALGAVGLRVIEGTFYAMGTVVLWSLLTLSRDFVDAGAPRDPHYATIGDTMLAQYHGLADVGLLMAFSLGGLAYYLVFYRSRLIPTWLSVWGIIGVGLLMVAAVLIIYGAITPLSPGQVALAAPIGLQEMVLAAWLIVKGFDQRVLEAWRP